MQMLMSSTNTPRRNDDRSRERKKSRNLEDAGGWNTVGSLNNRRPAFDPSRLNCKTFSRVSKKTG